MSSSSNSEIARSVMRALGDLERASPGARETFLDLHPDLRSILEDVARAAPSSAGSTLESHEKSHPGLPERIGPYRIREVLGEGGMGTVYLAEQSEPVRRRVALKIIKWGMDTREVLARFEAEQQALNLMNHPGIAQVIDAGATPEGRPYFVMEHVAGVPLTDYCDTQKTGLRERLGIFVRICRAVHHAHQKGIIHRDLKPSNILVTLVDGHAVPKIIDFGVAKATGQRLTEQTLFTELGRIIGTPEYMSPEQAEMSGMDVDTRTDVYSLGVILYELLVGALPFEPEVLRRGGYAEIQKVIREVDPPKPSTRINTPRPDSESVAAARATDPRGLCRHLRGDLDWITMRCLEKDRIRRYESAAQLAEDIERHLQNEPVLAGRPGPGYRLAKFARRHRAMVGSGVVILLALLLGLAAAERGRRMAEDSAERAQSAERTAAEQLEEVLRLSDMKRLTELEARAETLWPAVPEMLGALQEWQLEAEELAARLHSHRATLETLRAQALPYTAADTRAERETDPAARAREDREDRIETLNTEIEALRHDLLQTEHSGIPVQEETGPHRLTRGEIETRLAALDRQRLQLEREIAELATRIGQRRTWRFPTSEVQWRHDVLSELVLGLERLNGADPQESVLANVRERIQMARKIESDTIHSPEVAKAWSEAIADIAALPVYGGLRLRPQLGLIPLRRDPGSGLWEFWHVRSGQRPESNPDPDATSPWILTEKTGIVLILIPAGAVVMGAQSTDPGGGNYDAAASEREVPPTEVTLSAFFMGRYLVTQGQWLRMSGTNPSLYGPDTFIAGKQHDLRHPVEQVSWFDATAILARNSLVLPTEAQWEYAARADTRYPWWTGPEKETLRGAANLADRFARLNHESRWQWEEWLVDGYVLHSPVDRFRPSPWGLHDVHGNTWEWCRDRYGEYGKYPRDPGDGELLVPGTRNRVHRSGAYYFPAEMSRVSARYAMAPDKNNFMGVRASRPLR